MLTIDPIEQLSEILEALGQTLDISKSQYEAAVKSYQYVGEWLAKTGSPLVIYRPEVLPQGSFLLQTMIKPINEEDDLDVDLVCKLENILPGTMTQFILKQMVGNRLKANERLSNLLKMPDGRRCWTLQYADSAKFHMDILPSAVAAGYNKILEKTFESTILNDVDRLAIWITDKESDIYKASTTLRHWPKSNPFGYAVWFQERCAMASRSIKLMQEGTIQDFPQYQQNKMPLQRVVQILKRHRDMMWQDREDKEDKPISIIITTLAAKAYNREDNILDALINVLEKMPEHIEERWSGQHNREIKWISNPVNGQENFADKWPDNPEREKNFYAWLRQVKDDLEIVIKQRGQGVQFIGKAMEKPFGKDAASKALALYGERLRQKRESGLLHVAPQTGMVGLAGFTKIQNHLFYGKQEQ